MCTHEIWAYSECGCRVSHHVPCLTSLTLNTPLSPSPLRRTRRKTSLRGIRTPLPLKSQTHKPASETNPSPVHLHLPPSPSPTDSNFSSTIEDRYRPSTPPCARECSVNHTVDKTFLEPICDDCLLSELGIPALPNRNPPILPSAAGEGSGLIWSSDVQIEVEEQPVTGQPQPHAPILESAVEVLIDEGVRDTLSAPPSQESNLGHNYHRSTLSTTTTTNDADDEDDEHDDSRRLLRGRSRTKDLLLLRHRRRRRGLDVTREQLCLPSRLASTDRLALEAVASEQGQCKEQSPSKNFLTRFKSVERGGRTWVKGVVGELKRSLSRNSRRGRAGGQNGDDGEDEGDKGDEDGGTRVKENDTVGRGVRNGVYTLRAVAVDDNEEDDDADDDDDETSTCGTSLEDTAGKSTAADEDEKDDEDESACPAPDPPFIKPLPTSNSMSSWQAHLTSDLASHPRRVPILTSRSSSLLAPITASSSSHNPTTNSLNWLASPSLPLLNTNQQSLTPTRRLLSNTSTAPSIPTTASSTSSSPPIRQRLASIISESEFDVSAVPPWSIPIHPIRSGNNNDNDNVNTNSDADADVTTINDDASPSASNSPSTSDISTYARATSIDTNPSTYTTEAESTTPPRLHPTTPRPSALAIHPLTTPLTIYPLRIHPRTTPLRVASPSPIRPAFTPRTSSLASPALSSAMRLGGVGNGRGRCLTAEFVCVWERYLCAGGCGMVVGEGVERCFCGEGVGCRSTGPVVRYIESRGGNDGRGGDGDGMGSGGDGNGNGDLEGGICESCRS